MTDHDCSCGRLEGLTIKTLMEKTSCTDRFVCPRLDKARRTHPKFNEYLNRHNVAEAA